ncbi:hypothetical protein DOY81_009092 [Sarcophaga bullata]|nr:hypothetical protein DOY81_009092 [Sarcophaga bullata]
MVLYVLLPCPSNALKPIACHGHNENLSGGFKTSRNAGRFKIVVRAIEVSSQKLRKDK